MFTNWLTGTSSASTTQQQQQQHGNNNNNNRTEQHIVRQPNTLINAHTGGASAPGIMSTPPDVVLEVGPAPSVRFVAHSLVLGMHSGYLRSAIRLDEHANMLAGGHAGAAAADLALYLGNVTAEQFAPLLTYMYTGYLDLNVENIFGVLLATHLLHMPRALEICRSFLARAQTEGYLSNSLPNIPAASTNNSPNSVAASSHSNQPQPAKSNGQIIRPIPSKATLPNFGFLPIAMQQQLPLNNTAATVAGRVGVAEAAVNCFKSMQQQQQQQQQLSYAPPLLNEQELREQQLRMQAEAEDEDEGAEREEIVVDCNSSEYVVDAAEDDDDEVEVFIDSQSETENEAEIECLKRRGAHKSSELPSRESAKLELVRAPTPLRVLRRENERSQPSGSGSGSKATAPKAPAVQKQRPSKVAAAKREKRSRRQARQQPPASHNNNNNNNSKASTSSGLQVAKAPIPASQLLEPPESAKVIIDVASCDGPVRFRRILNTAYGHKPDAYAAVLLPERTQQSVSLSFHQQMAKAISQQRQLQHAEESENSESSGGGGGGTGAAASAGGGKHGSKAASNDIYVCVYCKHTFKSQYCYQKHAKRHLNPLSLSCASTSATAGADSAGQKLAAEANGAYARTHATPMPAIATSKQSAAELLLRREVRPLDMNVQYYPCKTCGSKFPSYYFVHKHRKMCHADEEAAESGSGRAGGVGTSGSASETAAEESDMAAVADKQVD